MNLNRKAIVVAMAALTAVPTFAAVDIGPLKLGAGIEVFYRDRQGKMEGMAQSRQDLGRTFRIELSGEKPLEDGWGLSWDIDTYAVAGDMTATTAQVTDSSGKTQTVLTGSPSSLWTNGFGNRQAWAALGSADFGQLRVGRQFLNSYLFTEDPYVGSANTSFYEKAVSASFPSGLTRISNAIWADTAVSYISPKLGGTTTVRSQLYWNNASIADLELVKAQATNDAPNTRGANGWDLGATFELPVARFDVAYGHQAQNIVGALPNTSNANLVPMDGVHDSNQFILAAKVPVGAHHVRAMVNGYSTVRPDGQKLNGTDLLVGAGYAFNSTVSLGATAMNHVVDRLSSDTNEYNYNEYRLDLKKTFSNGTAAVYVRPALRIWSNNERFTEVRIGFVAGF